MRFIQGAVLGVIMMASLAVSAHAATITKCPNGITVYLTNASSGPLVGGDYGGAGGIFIVTNPNNQNINPGQTIVQSAQSLTYSGNTSPRKFQAGFYINPPSTAADVAQCFASWGEMDLCPTFKQINIVASGGLNNQLSCSIVAQ